jgi:hypothetical protein
MANHAYLRVWTRGYSLEKMIPEFARFLATAPLSPSHDVFDELIVQAVDPGETPIAEWDLRPSQAGAAEVAALSAQHLNPDTAYIASATWDLWAFHMDTLKWQRTPQPLELTCNGPDYDDGIVSSVGHFQADLGFEHFFTGHAGLLVPSTSSNSNCKPPHPSHSSEHPVEHTFRQWMAAGNNLKEYHVKTRENIQLLFSWVEAIERALPVERAELWSEGEENMEARLDEILAQR